MPQLLRKPPRIKVLEAIGCLGDGRLKTIGDVCAEVVSSRGDKRYKVVVLPDNRVYSSDNGTRLKGYIGYPIIAFLMEKGVIPIDREVMKAMTGIPWKDLNEKYRRYAIVESIVVRRAERMGVRREIIYDYINIVLKKLGLMKLYYDETLENYECG